MESTQTEQHTPPVGKGGVRFGLIGLVIVFGVLFLLGTLPRLRNQSHLAALAQEAHSDVPAVTVVSPHVSAEADMLLPGNIQAIEEAVISARTSGYLRRRYVDIGSRVHAGQVLAEIEAPEVDQQFSQAQAQTTQARATVQQSQATVAQQNAAVQQSQANVAQQRAAVAQTQAQLASTRSKLAQSRAAKAQAEAALTKTQHDLSVQQANLNSMHSQQKLASVTNQRYQKLLTQGFVAQQEADQTQAALETANSNVAGAEASVSAAQADVDSAQQAVVASQAAVDSAESDVNAGLQSVNASQASLTSTQAAVQAARATVGAGRANVQANQAAVESNLANARHFAVMSGFERVVAPFDGVITARNVDAGALINAGSATTDSASTTAPRSGLFGLARTDVLRIQVGIPQSFISSIRPGQTVDVLVREYPGRIFTGTLFQSAGALDDTSRTLLTEVHIPNRDNTLKPGMFAQVRFQAPKTHVSLRIPSNTLIINALGTRVALVTSARKVHYVPVKIGRDYGTEVEISDGLKGDETLIANPTDDLKEDETVQASPVPPTTP